MSAYVREMHLAAGTLKKTEGGLKFGIRDMQLASASALTSLAIALMLDEPDFAEWISAAADRAIEVETERPGEMGRFLSEVDELATEIIAWTRDPEGTPTHEYF